MQTPVVETAPPRTSHPTWNPARAVWVVAITGALARLAIAASTRGTDDVWLFENFAHGAVRRGPLDIYAIDFHTLPYNHGPLTSWLIFAFGHLADAGASFPLLIRVPSSLADLVSTVVIFEMLRRRRGDRAAAVAAVVFAVSPLAVIISGFHGNTDSFFVMLSLVAILALDRERPGVAGLALGLAVSVKVVPVVLIPVLTVLAWRLGRKSLTRFVLGGAAVFAVLWLPVLVAVRGAFVSSYLGYPGIDPRQWGISQLLELVGLPHPTVVAIGSDARFLVVLASALLPLLVLRRRPGADIATVAALPLCLFLFLSPAFGMQYLVWPLAACLLVARLQVALAYVVSSSVFTLIVYCGWNQALPWHWDVARALPLPAVLVPLMFVVWAALGRVCWVGLTAVGDQPGHTEREPRALEMA